MREPQPRSNGKCGQRQESERYHNAKNETTFPTAAPSPDACEHKVSTRRGEASPEPPRHLGCGSISNHEWQERSNHPEHADECRNAQLKTELERIHVRRLTVKLNGRTLPFKTRQARTISSARMARTTASHGPFKRLLDAARQFPLPVSTFENVLSFGL